MSFLLFLILVVLGFTLLCLWRISTSLAIIAGCMGFDEVKKAGILEEIRESAEREILAAARKGGIA